MQHDGSTTKTGARDQSWYAEIYAITHDAQKSASGASPARLTQRMWTAIDQLRNQAAPSEDIVLAERTSLALHRFNLSRHMAHASHGFDLPEAVSELSSLADLWLRRVALELARC